VFLGFSNIRKQYRLIRVCGAKRTQQKNPEEQKNPEKNPGKEPREKNPGTARVFTGFSNIRK
jgi:hypothetical protein